MNSQLGFDFGKWVAVKNQWSDVYHIQFSSNEMSPSEKLVEKYGIEQFISSKDVAEQIAALMNEMREPYQENPDDYDPEYEREKYEDEIKVNIPQLFNDAGEVYCPICRSTFNHSAYLRTVIDDPRVLWIANMITHYRHNHITSWNKCWGYGGGRYRSKWFGDYETEKRKVNERAKRQIIRKAKAFLKLHDIKSAHFKGLEHNDEETIKLAKAALG